MKQDKKIHKAVRDADARFEHEAADAAEETAVDVKYEAPNLDDGHCIVSGYFKAAKGHVLPLFYKGSIILIGETPVEIDVEALQYESKHQFQTALKKKQIEETGV